MRRDTMWCAVAAAVDMLAQDGHQEMDAKRCKDIKTKSDKNGEAAGNINTVNNSNNSNNSTTTVTTKRERKKKQDKSMRAWKRKEDSSEQQ